MTRSTRSSGVSLADGLDSPSGTTPSARQQRQRAGSTTSNIGKRKREGLRLSPRATKKVKQEPAPSGDNSISDQEEGREDIRSAESVDEAANSLQIDSRNQESEELQDAANVIVDDVPTVSSLDGAADFREQISRDKQPQQLEDRPENPAEGSKPALGLQSTSYSSKIARGDNSSYGEVFQAQIVQDPCEWLDSQLFHNLDVLVSLSYSRALDCIDKTLTPKNQTKLWEQVDRVLHNFTQLSISDVVQLQTPETTARRVWQTYTVLLDSCIKAFGELEQIFSTQSAMRYLPLRRCSLATAIISLIGGKSGLLDFHGRFREILRCGSDTLKTWQLELLFEVKLRSFMEIKVDSKKGDFEIVEDLFPLDPTRMLGKTPLDGIATSADENEFFHRCTELRQDILNGYLKLDDANPWPNLIAAWMPGLRSHVRRVLIESESRRTSVAVPDMKDATEQHVTKISQGAENQPAFDYIHHEAPYSQNTDTYQEIPPAETDEEGYEPPYDQEEMVRRAVLAAHATLSGQSQANEVAPTAQMSSQPYNEELRAERNVFAENPPSDASPFSHDYLPTTSTSQPLGHSSIKEQYERARLAAQEKAAAKHKSQPVVSSQRKPWTREEEEALMTGLDRVQGPHWSQILAMFGPGGTVSEVLKDRNQVQLKDKARNIKLFFLKTGVEVPPYLRGVTGELKTRAPAQAAKHEAKERLHESRYEDRATADAISALAGTRPSSLNHANTQSALTSTSRTMPEQPASGTSVFTETLASESPVASLYSQNGFTAANTAQPLGPHDTAQPTTSTINESVDSTEDKDEALLRQRLQEQAVQGAVTSGDGNPGGPERGPDIVDRAIAAMAAVQAAADEGSEDNNIDTSKHSSEIGVSAV